MITLDTIDKENELANDLEENGEGNEVESYSKVQEQEEKAANSGQDPEE